MEESHVHQPYALLLEIHSELAPSEERFVFIALSTSLPVYRGASTSSTRSSGTAVPCSLQNTPSFVRSIVILPYFCDEFHGPTPAKRVGVMRVMYPGLLRYSLGGNSASGAI